MKIARIDSWLRRMSPAVIALAVAGCGGSYFPGSSADTSSEPVSQTPAVGDARNRAKIHTELASLYYQNGNMAVALEEIRISLAADSGYAPAYNVRGLIHMYLRENAAAEDSFRRAISLAQSDPEVNNNYGWFLCQTGRERESLAFFLTAIKNPLYPTPEKSYQNAGICAAKLGDLDAAEDYFQKALRLGPRGTKALVSLAEINYRRGRYDESRRQLGDLHRTGEITSESLWLALRTERRLGDRGAETGYAVQLRRRFPDSKEAQELKRGNYE